MTYLRTTNKHVKPALCPVDGTIFTVPPDMKGNKTCPYCKTVFRPPVIRELHRALETKPLPEFGKQVLVFGRVLSATESEWLQGHLTLNGGWRTGTDGAVPINDVTAWTELPVYAITIES